MGYLKYILVLGLLLGFSGCDRGERYKMAIQACIKQDGVPMLNSFGRMTECKFKGNLDAMIGGVKLGEIR